MAHHRLPLPRSVSQTRQRKREEIARVGLDFLENLRYGEALGGELDVVVGGVGCYYGYCVGVDLVSDFWYDGVIVRDAFAFVVGSIVVFGRGRADASCAKFGRPSGYHYFRNDHVVARAANIMIGWKRSRVQRSALLRLMVAIGLNQRR